MKDNLTSEDRNLFGVYLIHNEETGEAYIGSGILRNRAKNHRYHLNAQTHWNRNLQKAYNENPNFDFIGIATGEDRREALDLEQALIDDHWGNSLLLNICANVDQPMLGFNHSEGTREKISKIKEAQWQDPAFREKTVAAQAAGRAAMTEEERNARAEKIGTTLKSQYDSGERTSTKGQVRSEEFCRQNSSNVKSLWDDPEWRANMLEARKGKTVAPKKAIVADGVTYESMSAAALAFGISVASVAYRLDSPKFNWNRVNGTCC